MTMMESINNAKLSGDWNVQNGVPTTVNVFFMNTAGLP